MQSENPNRFPVTRAVVIGAGFGGLSAAMMLRAAGHEVTVLERHDWVGGKARSVPSDAGPVDAGPTVLTMRYVFDAVFAASSARLEDYAKLVPEPLLARHFWPDGSQLDLFSDRSASIDAVQAFAGSGAAREFAAFAEEAETLFSLFDAPMIQSGDPSVVALGQAALKAPRHLGTLSPFATLASRLKSRFKDARLRQLFGRYATYVGGSPLQSPALLSLIWQAEEAGVWRVEGGMHCLAQAMANRLNEVGGHIVLGADVRKVRAGLGQVTAVELASGDVIPADIVVFAGDPRALATGLLGQEVAKVAGITKTARRSLSARVWSFAATVSHPDLTHHNVFFAADPVSEFEALDQGDTPEDPTLYVCAEDRGTGLPTPTGPERFEIILNAAPLTDAAPEPNEVELCRQLTFPTLQRFGLTFAPDPPDTGLTTPTGFEALFPGSAGSLYGQSPHGMTASLKRPRARTVIGGLYLAGGGTHPGAGVPMAALSGQHAAAAILTDLALI
jgi:1-hydroxycarotenoid 3,4-desaturase